jgi:hypothetical protein
MSSKGTTVDPSKQGYHGIATEKHGKGRTEKEELTGAWPAAMEQR